MGVLMAARQQDSAIIDIRLGTFNIPAVSALDRMLSRGSWGDIATIVMYVLLLLFVFGAVEFLFGGYARLQDATKKNPHSTALRLDTSEQRWLLDRAAWRMVVGLIAIIVAILLVQLTHWVSVTEKTTIANFAIGAAFWRMGLATLIWVLVYHAIVVFIRLYSFRTRVFGDHGLY
jgi:uncharacterized membrane protein